MQTLLSCFALKTHSWTPIFIAFLPIQEQQTEPYSKRQNDYRKVLKRQLTSSEMCCSSIKRASLSDKWKPLCLKSAGDCSLLEGHRNAQGRVLNIPSELQLPEFFVEIRAVHLIYSIDDLLFVEENVSSLLHSQPSGCSASWSDIICRGEAQEMDRSCLGRGFYSPVTNGGGGSEGVTPPHF